jgi:hypothetical protein
MVMEAKRLTQALTLQRLRTLAMGAPVDGIA